MNETTSALPNDHLPGQPKELRRWPLVLIALDKILKAVGLLVVSFVLRALLSPDLHASVAEWINNERLEPHNQFIHYGFNLAEKGMGIQPDTLRHLRLGVIIYAGLYLIEGIGLMGGWKWAEWMVVITTALFLPLEIGVIYREVTWGRCLLFAVNVVVLVYLCVRLRQQARNEKALHG